MRCRYGLAIAVLALGASVASAQLDPASGQSAATLLAPQVNGFNDPLPPALPPTPSTDKANTATSLTMPSTLNKGDRLPPNNIPLIAPANYTAPSWPCHDYQGQADHSIEPWCASQPTVRVDADYLLWWMRRAPLPTLVTTGPSVSAGILGQPGTVPLFDGSSLCGCPNSGLRLGAGVWLDEFQTIGVEGNRFTLGSRSSTVAAGSSGGPSAPVVARPFFNSLSGSEDSELAELGGLLAGTTAVNSTTRLDGWEVNGLWNLGGDPNARIDLLVGYRSLQLNDGLTVLEDVTVPALGGTRLQIADEFHARSTLYAGQLGARLSYQLGNWDTKFTGKVALGSTHEEVTINGQTAVTPVGGPTTVLPGGLLALPSNIGQYSRDVFAVVPEVGINVGYQVTNAIHVGAGYSFLYWSNVVRAGDQIDRVVNPSQIPALQGAGLVADRPSFGFRETGFWAHGLTATLDFRY